jgi:hypothetical protein
MRGRYVADAWRRFVSCSDREEHTVGTGPRLTGNAHDQEGKTMHPVNVHPVNAEPELAFLNLRHRERLAAAEHRRSFRMHLAATSSPMSLATRLHRAWAGFMVVWRVGAHRTSISPAAPTARRGRV